MKTMKLGLVTAILSLVFLSPVFAGVTVTGKFKGGGKNGQPLTVTGGTIVLRNEKAEIVAEGELKQMGPYLAISAKDRTAFAHNPDVAPIEFPGMQEPAEFVNVDFAEGGEWMVTSGSLLILLKNEGLTSRMMAGLEPPVKVDLDASLARASSIRLPKGSHVLFGFQIIALDEGGTVRFANGKIVEKRNVNVQVYVPLPSPVVPSLFR